MILAGFIIVVPSTNDEPRAVLAYTIESISKRFNGDTGNVSVAGLGKGGDVAVGLKGVRACVVVSGAWKQTEANTDAPLLVIHGRNDVFNSSRFDFGN
jgi:pimeloyl-ACP methyl ester carboxylesterase